jgi:hypothetical protein
MPFVHRVDIETRPFRKVKERKKVQARFFRPYCLEKRPKSGTFSFEQTGVNVLIGTDLAQKFKTQKSEIGYNSNICELKIEI